MGTRHYQCDMQLCYWHNKTILLLSMRACLRDRVIIFHVMLCIIELVLAHAHTTTKRTPRVIFFSLFWISIPQFHVECITDRMWFSVDLLTWSLREVFLGMPSSTKCLKVIIFHNVVILTLVRWSIKLVWIFLPVFL